MPHVKNKTCKATKTILVREVSGMLKPPASMGLQSHEETANSIRELLNLGTMIGVMDGVAAPLKLGRKHSSEGSAN